MNIYKDIISGDEMFSNTFKIKEVENGMLYEVEGKLITRKEDVDESKFGANDSQEEVAEKTNESSVSGVDLIINYRLQKLHISKGDFKQSIKSYMKGIRAILEEKKSERVEHFKENAGPLVNKIVKNFDRYQFYTGESENEDGMLAMLDYRDDDVTPFMLFFKDGLEIEKC